MVKGEFLQQAGCRLDTRIYRSRAGYDTRSDSASVGATAPERGTAVFFEPHPLESLSAWPIPVRGERRLAMTGEIGARIKTQCPFNWPALPTRAGAHFPSRQCKAGQEGMIRFGLYTYTC